MTCVLLAAGSGERMMPLTTEIPKCLLPIDGRSLIERSLDHLVAAGMEEFVIVTGHKARRLRDVLGHRWKGRSITYVHNRRYSETGSMYSLLEAGNTLTGDVLLLESDLLYQHDALRDLLDSPYADAILIAKPLENGDDVYVCTDERNRITLLGKHIDVRDRARATGVLVGISRFSQAFLDSLFETARREIETGLLLRHYEETVLAAAGSGPPVHAVLVPDLIWTEVDTEQDLRYAQTTVYPRLREKGREAP